MNATSCEATISEGIDFLQQNEPESTDITEIAKCVSEKVLKAMRETERGTFVCQKYLNFGDNRTDDARMQLADKLWSLAKTQRERFETILWANKFYALCMRFILRTSQALQTDRYLDHAAKTAVLINSIANELCFVSPNKVCVCDANIVYNGFARANCLLPDIPGSDVGRSSVVSKIVDALRGNMVPLPGAQFIFHAPAVISYLWNEDYATVCKQLGAESLAHHDLSKVVERIGNTDLYTYAVRCACPCGHSAATGAFRARGNLTIARQEDGSIISDAGRDSSSTSLVPYFPSMAHRTFVGDFEQVSSANVNKRPAIQQQSNDATKRQRAVTDYPKTTPDNVTSNPDQRDISGSPDNAGSSSDVVRDDQAEGDMAETINSAYGPDTHTNSDDSVPVTNRVHDDCAKAAQPTQDPEGGLDESFTTFLMREMTENFGLDGGGALFNLHNWEHELLQGSFYETRYH
ncbi:hypothetical protein J3459_017958 [Metarhizium acridum]|nr:hypothetical protein J3459_017958 [Metarhizium acridum]